MAAIKIPAPGNEYGPCLDDSCVHRDCDESRAMANADCGICGDRIGYEERLYNDDEFGLVHALCLELAVDERKRRAIERM